MPPDEDCTWLGDRTSAEQERYSAMWRRPEEYSPGIRPLTATEQIYNITPPINPGI